MSEHFISRRRKRRHESMLICHLNEHTNLSEPHIAPADVYKGPECECPDCGALFWRAEAIKQTACRKLPEFNMCCKKGMVRLPTLQKPPAFLDALLNDTIYKESKKFRECVRVYNSMFAFTSAGGKIDYDINKRPGPYIFRISGQNYHAIGSLLPADGEKPKFAQLYVFDTINEVRNRISCFDQNNSTNSIDETIVNRLIAMFDECNEIAKSFRMARDRFVEDSLVPIKLKLVGRREYDNDQYAAPVASEIAGLLVGDFGYYDRNRDIVVEYKTGDLRRISCLHPSFMAMQFPILFPYGEGGYKIDIAYAPTTRNRRVKRAHVTMREYYAYFIQQRRSDQSALLRGGRLFQQFVVDAFTCIEQERLDFIKRNQKALRSEIYSGIRDAFFRGDNESTNIGKHVILPASYTGSPRYMMEHYHDAMAICRVFGHPDLFVTFTCNPAWPEISDMLAVIDGQTAENRPDIVSRVFKFKVDMLSKDIKSGKYFGPVSAFLYTVEFQKRGLPHIHCLIWLATSQKPLTTSQIDNIICAELPDPEVDLQCNKLVTKFMIHGPCGALNDRSPCMRNGKCSKHFPKKFRDETFMDEKGFGIYRRRDNGVYVEKKGIKIDNRFVVPYNPKLLKDFEAHLNVEFCCYSSLVKYLFKYISKGSDRVRAVLETTGDTTGANSAYRDEVKNFLDCRYISPCEAAWRIFEFPIQHREPAVEKLVVHLPNMNSVYFSEHVGIRQLYCNENIRKTMLTEWFSINAQFAEARDLTYSEFPSKWTWNSRDKIWQLRKRGRSIGRVTFVHPNAGELYYLRMLLNIVKGPRSFEEVRTIGEIQYPNFQATCMAYGLLGDDKEWNQVLDESTAWASSQQLRRIFVILLIFCDVGDPVRLFNTFWRTFADDVEYNIRRIFGIAAVIIPNELLKNHVLFELEKLLNRNGNTLSDYNLPMPAGSMFANSANKLIVEELSFDPLDLKIKYASMVGTLNIEQKTIHDDIVNSVQVGDGKHFFIYGHGGTGKTYLYETIIYRFRSEGKIVLVVASSGIASLLLPGGRTAHSRFKIPINLDDCSSCEIKRGTQLAELIKQSSLIIWDEAPMNHRYCFEAVDRSFRDILSASCEKLKELPFGGKTFVLGGDFRQILPVVPQGTKEDVLNASITKSYLWEMFKVYRLNINMRVSGGPDSSFFLPSCSFSQWLLSVGDGKHISTQIELFDEENNWIEIPSSFIINYNDNPTDSIINYVYTDFKKKYSHPTYLQERAIVCPRNEVVEKINSAVLDLVPEQDHIYYSYDSICNNSSNLEELLLLYPVEFLNTLQFNGFPQHALRLKLNTPVMLLRNLNPSVGLCNGTRLLLIQLGVRVIEAQIMTGSFAGDRVFIPRIVLSATDKKWPFILKRRQFPLRVCYAMTINKSQGQTLNKIGIFLDHPVFTHGQLYVALSRVTSENGIGLLIKKNEKDDEGKYLTYTKNVVYSEILQDL